jgi:ATP-dependent exoDNAse (exonuclease V) beta subunit
LEFPAVYIVGLEDGLIPHERSSTNDEELEEERRLLFVGITRAQEQLQLSRCLGRYRRNGIWPCIASRFLMELPREQMNCFEPAKSDPWANEGDGYEPDLSNVDPWMEDGFSADMFEEPKPVVKSNANASLPRVVTAAELEQLQSEINAIRLHPDRYVQATCNQRKSTEISSSAGSSRQPPVQKHRETPPLQERNGQITFESQTAARSCKPAAGAKPADIESHTATWQAARNVHFISRGVSHSRNQSETSIRL